MSKQHSLYVKLEIKVSYLGGKISNKNQVIQENSELQALSKRLFYLKKSKSYQSKSALRQIYLFLSNIDSGC